MNQNELLLNARIIWLYKCVCTPIDLYKQYFIVLQLNFIVLQLRNKHSSKDIKYEYMYLNYTNSIWRNKKIIYVCIKMSFK